MFVKFEVSGSVKKVALQDAMRSAEGLIGLARQFAGGADVRLSFQDQDGEVITLVDEFDSNYYFDQLNKEKKFLPVLFVAKLLSPKSEDTTQLTADVRKVQEEVCNLRKSLEAEASTKPSLKKAVHMHVGCNVCKKAPITGVRFKCLVCYDFDLCESCEKEGHPHPMIRCQTDYSSSVLGRLYAEHNKASPRSSSYNSDTML